MVQFKVYNDTYKTVYNHTFLDLYDNDPIKLTLSVEDIEKAETSSTYSKTFRVPGNAHNNSFFKNAFLVEGVDFDVTIKRPAEILVDGIEFKSGHVRLNNIYETADGTIDYEVLFMGETRDFSSSLGDKTLNQLNYLGVNLTHNLTYANVTQSWQAYPVGTLSDGLLNGDVLYPLINHGAIGIQTKISSTQAPGTFTNINYSLPLNRMKPMIRAKAIFDAIFQVAGCTYTSVFLNSARFKSMYISAFGSGDPSTTLGTVGGSTNPVQYLDSEYKMIDFIKDIFQMFRLVMEPDPINGKHFYIEPWADYTNSGTVYDWSHKVDHGKDIQINPLFMSQSQDIKFKMSEDGDWINKYHMDALKTPYGYLKYNSNSELLQGTTEYTVGFAPTPVTQINGATSTSEWIIPQICTRQLNSSGVLEEQPIKPKTRILFYNGLKLNIVNWFLDGNTQNYFPQVTSYETFPQTLTGLNLNFNNDIQYFGTSIPSYNVQGVTLYDEYWKTYTDSLYDPYGKKVSLSMVMNSQDFNGFRFNDMIFIDGVYYRPQKFNDVELLDNNLVKVDLIKAKPDYKPPFGESLNITLLATAPECYDSSTGIIEVTVDGTGPWNWSSSIGQSGQSLVSPFYIYNVPAGEVQVNITDSADISGSEVVTVLNAPQGDWNFTANHYQPTECDSEDGWFEVIVNSGAVLPYEINLQNNYGLNNTEFDNYGTWSTWTGLGIGDYTWTIIDANGCELSGTFSLTCNGTIIDPSYISHIANYDLFNTCHPGIPTKYWGFVVIEPGNASGLNGTYIYQNPYQYYYNPNLIVAYRDQDCFATSGWQWNSQILEDGVFYDVSQCEGGCLYTSYTVYETFPTTGKLIIIGN